MPAIPKDIKQAELPECPICGTHFVKYKTTQSVCGEISCAIQHGKNKDKKKKKRAARVALNEFRRDDRRHQLKLTQPVFNRLRVLQEKEWYTLRGLEPECISCGKKSDLCCGHLKTVGAHGELRFDEKNTYLQCNFHCNSNLSGNINGDKNSRGYIKGLYDRFGDDKAKEIIDYCETKREANWTCDDLVEMRKSFNKQIRRYNNANGI
jgi:hypothetical protein